MFNNREEKWINYFASLGAADDREGAELAKIADRLGVTDDELTEFAEAARKLKGRIDASNALDEAVGGPDDGGLVLAL